MTETDSLRPRRKSYNKLSSQPTCSETLVVAVVVVVAVVAVVVVVLAVAFLELFIIQPSALVRGRVDDTPPHGLGHEVPVLLGCGVGH